MLEIGFPLIKVDVEGEGGLSNSHNFVKIILYNFVLIFNEKLQKSIVNKQIFKDFIYSRVF